MALLIRTGQKLLLSLGEGRAIPDVEISSLYFLQVFTNIEQCCDLRMARLSDTLRSLVTLVDQLYLLEAEH